MNRSEFKWSVKRKVPLLVEAFETVIQVPNLTHISGIPQQPLLPQDQCKLVADVDSSGKQKKSILGPFSYIY